MLLLNLSVLSFVLYEVCSVKLPTLPVFLIDQNLVLKNYDLKSKSNPLTRMSQPEFADIVQKVIQKSDSVIVFLEKKLCSEDLAMKDKSGTPFSFLYTGLHDQKVKYLPSVNNPIQTLTRMLPPQQFSTFNVSFEVYPKIFDQQAYKYYYIHFADVKNRTRAETLRDHNIIMGKVYLIIQRLFQKPVTAFYTGIVNPIESVRVPAVFRKQSNRFIEDLVVSEGALFKFSGVYATSTFRRATFDHTPEIEEQVWKRNDGEDFTRMSTRMSYSDFELQFKFILRESDWTLDKVVLLEGGEEVGDTSMRVGLPWGRSYICWQPLLIINRRDASYVVISQYQLEPIKPCLYPERASRSGGQPKKPIKRSSFRFNCTRKVAKLQAREDTPETPDTPQVPQFHTPEHCEPYFTHQILAALMVSFLCLSILSSGVIMLMGCSGNDRYDDPHGKTIIIAQGGL